MSENNTEQVIPEEKLHDLKHTIVMQENENLRDKRKNDAAMTQWIKRKIEEVCKCYSNQSN